MAVSCFRQFLNLDYKTHLAISLALRLMLVAYGVYHDRISTVPYTDVDYKVYTDAARHLIHNRSPYERHTYRYTPLVAFLVIPNILFHHCFGKLLFSLVDLVDGILIRLIVKNAVKEYDSYKQKVSNSNGDSNSQTYVAIGGRNRKRSKHSAKSPKPNKLDPANGYDAICNVSMAAWLYNPMTIAIGTRGNCDSIAVFFVLLTLYLLQCKKRYFLAGLVHGVSIHFRLYPIVYSLTFFMHLSRFSFYSSEDRRQSKPVKQIENSKVPGETNENRKTVFKKAYLLYLVPNHDQVRLILGCLLSLAGLTGVFYCLYGYKFLYETYIYHLVRKDTRHNFSLYFYLQYLTAWIKNVGMWQKVLTTLPQVVLLVVFSFRHGLNRFSLNFSVLAQTIVMVTYNSVLTSQYFVWVMAVLPLCLWQIQMSSRSALFLLGIWFAAQAAWLLPAYFLEFHGQNTFLFIWIQSVSFFCANIAILGRLIMYFKPTKQKYGL